MLRILKYSFRYEDYLALYGFGDFHTEKGIKQTGVFFVIDLLINWVTLHLVPWHLLVGTWLHGHHGVPCRDHLFAITCLQISIDRQACLTKYIVVAILNVEDITRWQGVSFEIM